MIPILPAGITARRLHADPEAVTAFCEQADAFFRLVRGASSAAENARDLLSSRPAGVPLDRKHVVGFERNGAVVAIVDLLEAYPSEAEWYVGVLVLSPHERGRGLGTALWNAVEHWIRAEGGRHVRLIVQEQNPDAARFWRSVGFIGDGMVEQQLTTQTNSCWRFEKSLSDHATAR